MGDERPHPLGIVRDPLLGARNDVYMFSETLLAMGDAGAYGTPDPASVVVVCLGCRSVWRGDTDTICTCADGDPRYEEWHVVDVEMATVLAGAMTHVALTDRSAR